MSKIFRLAAVLACASLAACQSSLMTRGGAPTGPTTTDQASVIFMRPSSLGGAIQASVYDVTGEQSLFIGIVSSGTKLAWPTTPGEHRYMVVSEAADFMQATLSPGHVYHVLVSPRIGVWKARFSLIPLRNEPNGKYSLQTADFAKWDEATHYVSVTPAAQQWYQHNQAEIQAKRVSYWTKWQAKDAQDKAEATLRDSDGQ